VTTVDDRRLFTLAQRRELFVLAGGKCQSCGVDLPDDWEAHHKEAHSEGGPTDIGNGEALCPPCHRARHAERSGTSGMFVKDYSWQEKSIDHFMRYREDFYHEEPGRFKRAYLNEVSPSGGKTIFSMKLAARMIEAGLIDRVIWCVPKDNIKDGFGDDARLVEIAEQKRFIGIKCIRVDTRVTASPKAHLKYHHGAVITYQALPSWYGYLELLAKTYRLMFVFDEAHHGSAGEKEDDDAMNVWGEVMRRCREISHAVVCMTGTPLRSDQKRIPFVRYREIETSDGRSGYQVKSDYSFSYLDAVTAGIARRLICRNIDALITCEAEDDDGEIQIATRPITAIPTTELKRKQVKNAVFRSDYKAMDKMLKMARDECAAMRKTDPDAAILVIGRRDDVSGGRNSLARIAGRISALFSEAAVTVESADSKGARRDIRAFKRGEGVWIVAKEMISEGTNIPRLRIVVILRDIGNETFYQQLVHRVTRNDAEDRPQDAIVIQAQFPWLHQWGSDLEKQAREGFDKQKRPPVPPGPSESDGLPQRYINGIGAYIGSEVVVIHGEDFTDEDPIGRKIFEMIGHETMQARWQIDKNLKALKAIEADATSPFDGVQEALTVEEECEKFLELGNSKCRRAANNYGGSADNYRRIYASCKRAAGIKCELRDVIRDHPDPIGAARAFSNAATKAFLQSLRVRHSEETVT
jgi:superfamily II DNA or RNA helicase